jgi:hypothetical protein
MGASGPVHCGLGHRVEQHRTRGELNAPLRRERKIGKKLGTAIGQVLQVKRLEERRVLREVVSSPDVPSARIVRRRMSEHVEW